MKTEEAQSFEQLIMQIQNDIKDPLMAKSLIAILTMVFFDGLEKKELTELKIKDVLNNGSIVDRIDSLKVDLSLESKKALLEYLSVLQSTPGSNMDPSSFVFPSFSGASGLKKLQRKLKKYSNFDKLRRSGVRNFYGTLISGVMDHKRAVKETSKKFRLTERTVEDILRGRTKPAGKTQPAERIDKYDNDLVVLFYKNIIEAVSNFDVENLINKYYQKEERKYQSLSPRKKKGYEPDVETIIIFHSILTLVYYYIYTKHIHMKDGEILNFLGFIPPARMVVEDNGEELPEENEWEKEVKGKKDELFNDLKDSLNSCDHFEKLSYKKKYILDLYKSIKKDLIDFEKKRVEKLEHKNMQEDIGEKERKNKGRNKKRNKRKEFFAGDGSTIYDNEDEEADAENTNLEGSFSYKNEEVDDENSDSEDRFYDEDNDFYDRDD